jgi:predicted regulator of Ras-like GTPase activity (Roadblock/LC7/MglB family)
MYKLTFRIPALASVVAMLAILWVCMEQYPAAKVAMPIALIPVALLAAPVIVAFLFYGKASIIQKLKIAVIGAVFGSLYGLFAQIHYGTTLVLPNDQVLINEYLVTVMAAGGAITALLLCKVAPDEVGALRKPPAEAVKTDAIKEDESKAKSSSTKLPAQSETLKPAASISSTNLKGILDNLSPDDDEAGNAPPQPAKSGLAGSLPNTKAAAAKTTSETSAPASNAGASPPTTPTPAPTSNAATSSTSTQSALPTDSQSNLPGQKKATTGAGASSTATRLQAQKRKSTSTFTKLQALSASGTGGIRQKPTEQSGGDNDVDSLKSILDRLDTKQEDIYAAPDEVEMDSLFGQESLLSPHEVPEPPLPAPSPVVTPETPKPASQAPKPVTPLAPAPAPTPAPAAPVTPPASITPSAQTMPVVHAPKPSTAKQFDSSPSPLAKKPEPAPSLSSMLDSLDLPKTASAKTPAPSTTGSAQTSNKPATPTQTSTPTSTPAKPVTPPSPTVNPIKPATPAPAEASKPVAKSATPTSTPKVSEPPKPEPVKPELVKAEADSGLFETGLDKEIDDIFSNLVPAEAQKNVQSNEQTGSLSEQPPEYETEGESEVFEPLTSLAEEPDQEKEAVFETKIDQELDDIFSNLVPAEAQKEVAPKSAAAEKKPVEAKALEEEKKAAAVEKEHPVVEEQAPIVEEHTPIVEEQTPIVEEHTLVAEENIAVAEELEEQAPVIEERKAEPEPIVVPEPVKAESTVLAESGLDRELDDIFSNLAPSEAQRSVTHETLARVRAADVTGDHPALTPENSLKANTKTQEEMSFAPPSEIESRDFQEQEEQLEREAEVAKTGKFQETLHAIPSLQATVEGLLNNLAASELQKNETESFAPPASKEPGNGSGVATKVLDLIESLELDHQSQAQESVRAVESSSGDLVNDLFSDSTKEAAQAEPNDELITESSTDAVIEVAEEEAKPEEPAAEPEQTVEPEQEQAPQAEQAAEEVIAAAEVQPQVTPSEVTAEAEKESSRASDANKKTAKELKEFGRLSSKQGSTDFASETAGTMKTIGKLLIEVQAVENIIKAGESGTIGSGLTTARVISAARGEGIKALLSKIDSYNGVDGSVIVGHDGLVIASTAGPGMDRDTLGVLSVACLSTSNLATKKLEIGKLRQMVLVTDSKTTVLTDVDVGILAVFLDNNDVGKIDGLLEAIHDTIHG